MNDKHLSPKNPPNSAPNTKHPRTFKMTFLSPMKMYEYEKCLTMEDCFALYTKNIVQYQKDMNDEFVAFTTKMRAFAQSYDISPDELAKFQAFKQLMSGKGMLSNSPNSVDTAKNILLEVQQLLDYYTRHRHIVNNSERELEIMKTKLNEYYSFASEEDKNRIAECYGSGFLKHLGEGQLQSVMTVEGNEVFTAIEDTIYSKLSRDALRRVKDEYYRTTPPKRAYSPQLAPIEVERTDSLDTSQLLGKRGTIQDTHTSPAKVQQTIPVYQHPPQLCDGFKKDGSKCNASVKKDTTRCVHHQKV